MFSYRWFKFHFGMLSFPDIQPLAFLTNLPPKMYVIPHIQRQWALKKQGNKIETILFPLPFSETAVCVVTVTIKMLKTYIELCQAQVSISVINSYDPYINPISLTVLQNKKRRPFSIIIIFALIR